MHSEYEDRAPDLNLAIGLGAAVAVALLSSLFWPGTPDAVVNAAIAHEVHARACISQGAIYERMPKPKCAGGTYDVPANALSYPLASKETR